MPVVRQENHAEAHLRASLPPQRQRLVRDRLQGRQREQAQSRGRRERGVQIGGFVRGERQGGQHGRLQVQDARGDQGPRRGGQERQRIQQRRRFHWPWLQW